MVSGRRGFCRVVTALLVASAVVLVADRATAASLEIAADSSTSDESSSSDQNGLIILTMAVAGIATLLIVTMVRSDRSGSRWGRPGAFTNWSERVRQVCAEGQHVVNLTTAVRPNERGSGMSVDQLSRVESRLDLLIAHLRELRLTAPSEMSGQAIGLATTHASVLNDVVQTERRIRLSSTSPDDELLAEVALQLAAERVALDEALRDMAESTAGAP